VERDENYVPYLRSDYKLPSESKATKADYAEIFEETPIYTLFWMGIMQWLCVTIPLIIWGYEE
jgi:hypothetical protein